MGKKAGIDGLLAYINAFFGWAIKIFETPNLNIFDGLVSAFEKAKEALAFRGL